MRLPTRRFQPPGEPRNTDVTGIADSPLLPEISYDNYYADDDSDESSHMGSAEGEPPISLKETEFSLKQFAQWMW